jgi:hypothetical protein
VKRAAAVLVPFIALAACGPGTRCPTLHGETVSARPLRCADLLADSKRFDGEIIDVRGRFEHSMLGPRLRLLDVGGSGDCGRIAGSGVIVRLVVDEKVKRDCTNGLDRKFARVVGKLKIAPDAAGGLGEVEPVAIVYEEN